MSDKERSTEIADRIVDGWANMEAGPLDIPKGRLWILRQSIAEAIRAERCCSENDGQGISSKDREFLELQERERYARLRGWLHNDYVCGDCLLEGKSKAGSTYLDWPADIVDGQPKCSKHLRIRYVCKDCESEGKPVTDSTYFGRPARFHNGDPLCAYHGKQRDSDEDLALVILRSRALA